MWSLSVYSEDGELLQSSFEVAAGKVQFWICGFYSLREQHSRVFVIPSDSVYCVSLVQRRHVFIACWLLWSFSSRFTRRPSQTWTNESRRETGCLSEMLPHFLGAQLALVLPAWLAHESTFVVSLLWHFHVSKYRRHVHCHFCFAPCSKFGKSTELPLPTFRFLEPFPLFTPIVAYTKHMTLWKKTAKKAFAFPAFAAVTSEAGRWRNEVWKCKARTKLENMLKNFSGGTDDTTTLQYL